MRVHQQFDRPQRLRIWSQLAVALLLLGWGGCQDAQQPEGLGSLDSDTGPQQLSTHRTTPAIPTVNAPASTIDFTDWTANAGIDFVYENGEDAGYFAILESLGGGVAVLDFDRDHREDLYFAGGGAFEQGPTTIGLSCGLFRNLGEMQFVSATRPAVATAAGYYNHGIIRGDYDADGFCDVLVTGYGGVQLLHNLGDGTFEEVTAVAHLDDRQWSSSAAWGDLNGDGHLDLYVTHYVDWSFENNPVCTAGNPDLQDVCPPRQYSGLDDHVYLSNADGTFHDASAAMGLLPGGKGLGVVAADLDRDGDLDVYVTNDTVPNHLYENTGQGTFKDRSLMSGTSLSDRGVPDGSMGVELFDYNRDGLLDLWVVNYENESAALYRNEGRMTFRHVSSPTGVTDVGGLFVGWGTCCFDFDHDADEDIFVSNGHVIRHPSNSPLRQLPLFFENLGTGRFQNVAPHSAGYLSEPHMGRGAATGDLDGDGALDLAVSHTNEPVAVLRNQSTENAAWLMIDLIGTVSPRDPVGATVEVVTAGGTQVRHYAGGGSYASTSSRRLHFGLGAATEVEQLVITWPSGIQTVRTHDISLNSTQQIVERMQTADISAPTVSETQSF